MTLEEAISMLEDDSPDTVTVVLTNGELTAWLKELQKLREKHWDECRQIAHYDDELNGKYATGGYVNPEKLKAALGMEVE